MSFITALFSNTFQRFVFFLLILSGFASSSLSHADTFTVVNTNDSGPGSLRQAVLDANALAGDDVINFDASLAYQTITLTSGEIVIGVAYNNHSLTITGPLAGIPNSIVLNGNDNSRIFSTVGLYQPSNPANYGLLTLENLTLTHGHSFGSDDGGALYTAGMSLTLNDCVIADNISDDLGGGVYLRTGNYAVFNRTVIANNTSSSSGGGIGIYADFPTTFNASLIDNNNSGPLGGGIYSLSALTLNQSTASNNTATHSGGGVYMLSNTNLGSGTVKQLTLNQSTISGNSATAFDGGGIYLNRSNINLNQTTITNNSSGSRSGGLSTFNANSSDNITITMTSTILAGNTGPEGNFYHSLGSGTGIATINASYSLFGDTGEINGTDIGNIINNTPDLGPLQYNGGMTPTHKPNESSPANNTSKNTLAPETTDQRGAGFPRIHNMTLDIGAVELQNNTVAGDPPLNTDEVLTRRDMARELLKATNVAGFMPPPATGTVYDDVKVGDINADWIEQFEDDGYTEGCDTNKFCPNMVVSREEMTKIFIKVQELDGNYSPPTATNDTYNDVPQGHPLLDWVEDLVIRGVTSGCDANNFCPDEPVTRKWFDELLGEL